jgi:hypothetical protein
VSKVAIKAGQKNRISREINRWGRATMLWKSSALVNEGSIATEIAFTHVEQAQYVNNYSSFRPD